eukprot:TRINITY_DN16282_c0_g1_i2.p1 TRINITY_DN16282_c0_g1~~TRINITY_DN16282_c0_g1_i2.p1  ORF type:complete len:1348 (+),score=237.70 TRINITY_DN16282_c0_g1_i2:54-4097(+)
MAAGELHLKHEFDVAQQLRAIPVRVEHSRLDTHMDSVAFRQPVVVTHARVIATEGSCRTEPADAHVELFYRDLLAPPDSATFRLLPRLSAKRMQRPDPPIATNHLMIRGHYKSLCLSLHGFPLTDSFRKHASLMRSKPAGAPEPRTQVTAESDVPSHEVLRKAKWDPQTTLDRLTERPWQRLSSLHRLSEGLPGSQQTSPGGFKDVRYDLDVGADYWRCAPDHAQVRGEGDDSRMVSPYFKRLTRRAAGLCLYIARQAQGWGAEVPRWVAATAPGVDLEAPAREDAGIPDDLFAAAAKSLADILQCARPPRSAPEPVLHDDIMSVLLHDIIPAVRVVCLPLHLALQPESSVPLAAVEASAAFLVHVYEQPRLVQQLHSTMQGAQGATWHTLAMALGIEHTDHKVSVPGPPNVELVWTLLDKWSMWADRQPGAKPVPITPQAAASLRTVLALHKAHRLCGTVAKALRESVRELERSGSGCVPNRAESGFVLRKAADSVRDMLSVGFFAPCSSSVTFVPRVLQRTQQGEECLPATLPRDAPVADRHFIVHRVVPLLCAVLHAWIENKPSAESAHDLAGVVGLCLLSFAASRQGLALLCLNYLCVEDAVRKLASCRPAPADKAAILAVPLTSYLSEAEGMLVQGFSAPQRVWPVLSAVCELLPLHYHAVQACDLLAECACSESSQRSAGNDDDSDTTSDGSAGVLAASGLPGGAGSLLPLAEGLSEKVFPALTVLHVMACSSLAGASAVAQILMTAEGAAALHPALLDLHPGDCSAHLAAWIFIRAVATPAGPRLLLCFGPEVASHAVRFVSEQAQHADLDAAGVGNTMRSNMLRPWRELFAFAEPAAILHLRGCQGLLGHAQATLLNLQHCWRQIEGGSGTVRPVDALLSSAVSAIGCFAELSSDNDAFCCLLLQRYGQSGDRRTDLLTLVADALRSSTRLVHTPDLRVTYPVRLGSDPRLALKHSLLELHCLRTIRAVLRQSRRSGEQYRNPAVVSAVAESYAGLVRCNALVGALRVQCLEVAREALSEYWGLPRCRPRRDPEWMPRDGRSDLPVDIVLTFGTTSPTALFGVLALAADITRVARDHFKHKARQQPSGSPPRKRRRPGPQGDLCMQTVLRNLLPVVRELTTVAVNATLPSPAGAVRDERRPAADRGVAHVLLCILQNASAGGSTELFAFRALEGLLRAEPWCQLVDAVAADQPAFERCPPVLRLFNTATSALLSDVCPAEMLLNAKRAISDRRDLFPTTLSVWAKLDPDSQRPLQDPPSAAARADDDWRGQQGGKGWMSRSFREQTLNTSRLPSRHVDDVSGQHRLEMANPVGARASTAAPALLGILTEEEGKRRQEAG